MSDEKLRVSIGLDSAPPVAVRLTETQITALHDALSAGGWQDLEADDARLRINVDKVVFVRIDKDEPKIGFGL